MKSTAGQPLPDDTTVLRALEIKRPFFEDPDHRYPTGNAFKPNSRDIEDGRERGVPPGVSVFDSSKAMPEHAVAIRQWFVERGGREFLPMRVFALGVTEVRQLGRAYNPEVDVVADPISTPVARDLPGADGHASIWGLYEPVRRKRRSPKYKALLDRFAMASSEVYRSDP